MILLILKNYFSVHLYHFSKYILKLGKFNNVTLNILKLLIMEVPVCWTV